MNKDISYFRNRMFFFATIIVVVLALAIPGFYYQPDIQIKLALAIPCVLAGAWSLPPLLVRTMHGMMSVYERITRQRVRD